MARRSHPTPHSGFPPALVERVFDDAIAGGQPAMPVGPQQSTGPTPTRRPDQPVVYGITGVQGSGKSRLAAQLAKLGQDRGLHFVVLSIDDFYLSRRERQALGRREHPLLATRGPPGTHDIELACRTLNSLRNFSPGDCVALPRFDKLGDRRLPPSRWPRIRRLPDLVILEGWFLAVPPEPEVDLEPALNSLERKEDPDGRWRRYCNQSLANYQPLWQLLDRLLWLRGPGFEIVPNWRWQQEAALQASSPARTAMSRAQVARFVQLFERVSRHGQATLAGIADSIVELDEQRRPMGELRRR